MALIQCPECSTEVSENAAECIKCGYPIRDIIKCPDCGTYNAGKPEACVRCGAPLTVTAAVSAPAYRSAYPDTGGEEDFDGDSGKELKESATDLEDEESGPKIGIGDVGKLLSALGSLAITIAIIMLIVSLICGDGDDDSKQAGTLESRTGTLTDSRDGKTYRTVKIGNKTWMAENLNYKTANARCYQNKDFFCNKYGLLYHFGAAKTACPSGWHLPNRNEWSDLINIAGKGALFEDITAAKKLKSKDVWMNDDKGTDVFGFSALPGGRSVANVSGNTGGILGTIIDNAYGGEGFFGDFTGADKYSYWWSSEERGPEEAYHVEIVGGIEESYGSKSYGLSVRCVQN